MHQKNSLLHSDHRFEFRITLLRLEGNAVNSPRSIDARDLLRFQMSEHLAVISDVFGPAMSIVLYRLPA